MLIDLMHFGHFQLDFLLVQELGWVIDAHRMVVERYAAGPATVAYSDTSGSRIDMSKYSSGIRETGQGERHTHSFRDMLQSEAARAKLSGQIAQVKHLAPRAK